MKSGRSNNKGGKPGPASRKAERDRWMEASWSDEGSQDEGTSDSLSDLFIPINPPSSGTVNSQVSLPGMKAEERKSKEKAPASNEKAEDAQNVKKGGRKDVKPRGSQENRLNLQAEEAASNRNVTPVNSRETSGRPANPVSVSDVGDTRQERETFTFATGENSGRLMISNQRFDLVGDSQNFTVTGPGNDIKVCSNKMKISVIGEDNVIRYNTRFTTDISATGRGNRAVGYEYGNGERGTVITSHNTSPSSNSLRVVTTESNRSRSSPPSLIAPSSSTSTIPPLKSQKPSPSGFLQSLRNVFSRNRNNDSQREASDRQLSLPGIRAEERKSKDKKESPIEKAESAQNASTSATSTTATPSKSASATTSTPTPTKSASSSRIISLPTASASATASTPSKTASATISDSKEKVATKRSSTDATISSSLSKKSRTDINQRTTRSSTASGTFQSTPASAGRLSESLSSRRLIVSDQNSAYQASLRADQEKDEQKKRQEQEKLRKKEEKERKNEMIRKLKEEALASLPEEPALVNDSGRDNNVFTIQIKFPSGTIIRRNFRRTDTVSNILQFVYSHPECPNDYSLLRRPSGAFAPGGAENELELGQLGFTSETLLLQSEEDD